MNIRSKKGFTLVEIMIVVVIIGLLAAMAIPAFQKVRRNSIKSTIINDARQMASGAQQYYMENNCTTIGFGYVSASGAVSGNLAQYVKTLGKRYTLSSDTELQMDSSFTITQPIAGTGQFDGEGHLLTWSDTQ